MNMAQAKGALRYLRSTRNNISTMKPGASTQLSAYVDSSSASSTKRNRRSGAGILIYYGDVLKYVTSFTRKRVTLSSTESELVALSEACRTLAWLRQVGHELQATQKHTLIFQDNAGSIGRAEGGSAKYFARRKYIDVCHQHISKMRVNQKIFLARVPTREVKVDFLTKPLEPGPFKDAINNLQNMK